MKRVWVLLCVLWVFYPCQTIFADDILQDTESAENWNYDEIEEKLQESLPEHTVHFQDILDTVKSGSFEKIGQEAGQYAKELLISEIASNRTLLVQVLLLTIVFSILHQFADIFPSSKVSEAGFFLVYATLLLLLFQSFQVINGVVRQTLSNLCLFMKALVPVFAGTIVFSGAPTTAMWYGELTICLIYLVEMGMEHIVLPLIHGYLVVEFLNGMTQKEVLGGFGGLLQSAVKWMLRVTGSMVFGISLIQNMMAPSLDRMKLLGSRKIMGLLPGIGVASDTVTQLLIGSGSVIKSSLGSAAVLAVFLICFVPVVKVAVMLFFYKIIAAVTESVADRRMAKTLNQTAGAVNLLARLLFTVCGMFVTTIALVLITGKG
ncbi:MAG: stage III sporulation protein AE [Lachnospiraceae bacterium]